MVREMGHLRHALPVSTRSPGVDKNGVIRSLAMPETLDVTRQDILDYFDNTWALTEVLFSSLVGEEAFYRPPYHHLRHPMSECGFGASASGCGL